MTDLGDVMLCQKSLHENCWMGRRIVVMKLICLLSQQCLTADWLAPRKSDCSQMHSKVSSVCLFTSRPCKWFSRYSKWLDTFWTALAHSSQHLPNISTSSKHLRLSFPLLLPSGLPSNIFSTTLLWYILAKCPTHSCLFFLINTSTNKRT